MLKKRLKRALRSWGLVGPVKPGVTRLPRGEARAVVDDLYQSMLKRPASPDEREASIAGLVSGDLTISQLVQRLSASDEFGTTFIQNPAAARQVAAAVLSSLADVASETAVEAYATGLENGLPLPDFLQEICRSPEFMARWSDVQATAQQSSHNEGAAARARSLRASSTVPGELGQMVENLIMARMAGEGATLALPPLDNQQLAPLPTQTLIGLVRTLDMMADRPAGEAPGVSAQARAKRSRA